MSHRQFHPQCGHAAAYSVFVVNADGTGRLNLTAGSGDATNAIWLPRH